MPVETGLRLSVPWNPVNYLNVKDEHLGSDGDSNFIHSLWRNKRQTEFTYKCKLKMIRDLQVNVFQDFSISITGSSANGFGSNNSDVDLCIEFKNHFLPIQYDSVKILRGLQGQMAGVNCYHKTQVINAICPLLSFTYKRPSEVAIKVDINLANRVGIVNTQMLYAYSRMDARVAPLVAAIKLWATTMGIKDARQGRLASYTLTLLAVFYLQRTHVVPVLHPKVPEFESGRGFESDEPLLLPVWSSPNLKRLGQLFQGFLQFYADFDFESNCISVRRGSILSIDEAIADDPDELKYKTRSSREWWNFVNVQEPFNFTNVGRAVHTKKAYKEIIQAFKLSSQTIRQRNGIRSLFPATKLPATEKS